ncbi:hypothetical protein ACR0ST_13055, partial [Aliidiomarina sp. Khilg15.8]
LNFFFSGCARLYSGASTGCRGVCAATTEANYIDPRSPRNPFSCLFSLSRIVRWIFVRSDGFNG